jgi:hypothetical protein
MQKERPMLSRLTMVLAGAFLAGGLAVTGAHARGGGFGGGHIGGFGGGHIGVMGGTFGGARFGGLAGTRFGDGPGFAGGFRAGRRFGDFRPGFGRAYGYPGYGYGYDYYDDGYDECEIDTLYGRRRTRCY